MPSPTVFSKLRQQHYSQRSGRSHGLRLKHASEAQWNSGAGVLPFPRDPSDSKGFARYVNNVLLEDGATWSRVLETHPSGLATGT
jgi:hypothetical protein